MRHSWRTWTWRRGNCRERFEKANVEDELLERTETLFTLILSWFSSELIKSEWKHFWLKSLSKFNLFSWWCLFIKGFEWLPSSSKTTFLSNSYLPDYSQIAFLLPRVMKWRTWVFMLITLTSCSVQKSKTSHFTIKLFNFIVV